MGKPWLLCSSACSHSMNSIRAERENDRPVATSFHRKRPGPFPQRLSDRAVLRVRLGAILRLLLPPVALAAESSPDSIAPRELANSVRAFASAGIRSSLVSHQGSRRQSTRAPRISASVLAAGRTPHPRSHQPGCAQSIGDVGAGAKPTGKPPQNVMHTRPELLWLLLHAGKARH